MKKLTHTRKQLQDCQQCYRKYNCLNWLGISSQEFMKIIGVLSLLFLCVLVFKFQISNTEDNQYGHLITTQQAFHYIIQTEPHLQIFSEDREIETSQLKKWKLPKIVWTYKTLNQEVPSPHPVFNIFNHFNTKHFAQQANYTFVQINDQNFHEYLSFSASRKIASVIQTIQERMQSQNYRNSYDQIKQNKQKIFKRLIVYFVLLEKGGVFVDDSVTILESFGTWIQDILNVPYINVGDRLNSKIEPKCFGFYHKDFSSIRSKVNVKREFEFEKSMVIFPSLEDDFLACDKNSEFLSKVIEVYLQILLKEDKSLKLSKLNSDQSLIGKTNRYETYKHGHLLAVHAVLQQRQHFLNLKQDSTFTKLAIDDFQLVTINAYIGCFKIQHAVSRNKQLYSFLTKMRINQLEKITGPLRFISIIDNQIKELFQNQLVQDQTQTRFFMQKSFFHTYFLKYSEKKQVRQVILKFLEQSLKAKNQTEIIPTFKTPLLHPGTPQLNQNVNNPQWESLVKNVWVIWDKGLKGRSSLMVELCYQNLIRSAQNSGFKLHFVTDNNVNDYIDKQTLQKIKYALTHADYEVTKQAETDLWRLALLQKYGGIYLDASTFTMNENFDWLKNITRIPSKYLWNRYGNEPKTLMFWNAAYCQPGDWHIDQKYNLKSQWLLSYENNFIVSVQKNELIKEWLQVFLDWMVSPFDKIQLQMKDVGMFREKWTNTQSRYLLAMDAIRYVIGRKQKFLTQTNNTEYQSASDYYKIWSMPGNMNGQQKLRGQTNYENMDYRIHWIQRDNNNLFRHEFPIQVAESVIGPIQYQSKFFGFDMKFANILLERLYRQNKRNFNFAILDQIIHPKSVLASKILNRNLQKSLDLMEYYVNLRQMKTKLTGMNKLGI